MRYNVTFEGPDAPFTVKGMSDEQINAFSFLTILSKEEQTVKVGDKVRVKRGVNEPQPASGEVGTVAVVADGVAVVAFPDLFFPRRYMVECLTIL